MNVIYHNIKVRRYLELAAMTPSRFAVINDLKAQEMQNIRSLLGFEPESTADLLPRETTSN